MQNMFDYCTNYVKRYLLYGCIIIRGMQEFENIRFPNVSCNLKLSEFPIISNYEIPWGPIRSDHQVLDIFDFSHISICYTVRTRVRI